MHRRSAMIESLEDRRHLSVAASILTGPLTKGTTWNYQGTSSGTSFTINAKVVGAAKVGSTSTTEIDSTNKFGSITSTNKNYVALNSAGYVWYKQVTQTTASTFSNKQVQQPSPYNVDFPKTMTAGKNYSFKWTSKITTTGTVNSVLTDSIAYTVKLLSDKTTKVKVPAGTFDCYTLQSTTKTTENGQTVTTSTTQYIAANVGVVKLVSGALTQLLSKFVKGK